MQATNIIILAAAIILRTDIIVIGAANIVIRADNIIIWDYYPANVM